MQLTHAVHMCAQVGVMRPGERFDSEHWKTKLIFVRVHVHPLSYAHAHEQLADTHLCMCMCMCMCIVCMHVCVYPLTRVHVCAQH